MLQANNLFTPRLSYASSERLHMTLSVEDHAKVRRGRWCAEVTNQDTGRRYSVRGASCGISRCFCDAVIMKEVA